MNNPIASGELLNLGKEKNLWFSVVNSIEVCQFLLGNPLELQLENVWTLQEKQIQVELNVKTIESQKND